MTFSKSILTCGSAISCLLIVQALRAQVPGSASGHSSSPLTLPDLAQLRTEAVARKFSAVNRDLRMRLFRQLEIMTTNHLRIYLQARLPSAVEYDAAGWVSRRVTFRGIPGPDRASIAAVLLQIDLLDAVLAARDPRAAEALREGRKKHRVRNQDEAVFGDRRDQFLFFCLDEFAEIAQLQAALGGGSLGGWESGAAARSPGEAETRLVESCARLAERSRHLQ